LAQTHNCFQLCFPRGSHEGYGAKRRQEGSDETGVRARILEAAFAAFMEKGYATTSTLEIATRARVSKRELYAEHTRSLFALRPQ